MLSQDTVERRGDRLARAQQRKRDVTPLLIAQQAHPISHFRNELSVIPDLLPDDRSPEKEKAGSDERREKRDAAHPYLYTAPTSW
jgi:hypothetical protein